MSFTFISTSALTTNQTLTRTAVVAGAVVGGGLSGVHGHDLGVPHIARQPIGQRRRR